MFSTFRCIHDVDGFKVGGSFDITELDVRCVLGIILTDNLALCDMCIFQ